MKYYIWLGLRILGLLVVVILSIKPANNVRARAGACV